jgi:hypothetical protein
MRTRIMSAVAATIAVCALAACSATSGSTDSSSGVKRPTQAEIAEDLQKTNSPIPVETPEAATCIAGVLYKSPLSNEGLLAFVTSDGAHSNSSADNAALGKAFNQITSSCADELMGSAMPSDIPTAVPTS